MRALIVGLLALLAMPALAAERAQVRLADVLISYDAKRWRVSSEVVPPTILFSGLRLGRQFIIFRCIAKPPVCFDEPMLFASAHPVEKDEAAPEDLLFGKRLRGENTLTPLWDTFADARSYGGLVLHGRKEHTGCRAYTPAMLGAVGRHEGIRYTFSSGFSSGCRGIEGVPEKMFDELIAGVSLIGAEQPLDKANP